MDFGEIFTLALQVFIIVNPIGNSPAIAILLKRFSVEEQKRILRRETCLAFLLAVFFQFFGEVFLQGLDLARYTVSLCGGILLFSVALGLLFPRSEESTSESKETPFFVPIATPLLAGPGLLAMIMIDSHSVFSQLSMVLSLLIAFLGVGLILHFAPQLSKLGKRGVMVLEQIMGMLLALISVGMIVKGIQLYIESL